MNVREGREEKQRERDAETDGRMHVSAYVSVYGRRVQQRGRVLVMHKVVQRCDNELDIHILSRLCIPEGHTQRTSTKVYATYTRTNPKGAWVQGVDKRTNSKIISNLIRHGRSSVPSGGTIARTYATDWQDKRTVDIKGMY